MSYIQIAHRDDGYVARIIGDNHEVVFTTGSQLYDDERGALNAVRVAGEAFGFAAAVATDLDPEAAGWAITAVDERDGARSQAVDGRQDIDEGRAVAIGVLAAKKRAAFAQEHLVEAVAAAREYGLSWTKIGRLFGVSRQAAWERFHRKVDVA